MESREATGTKERQVLLELTELRATTQIVLGVAMMIVPS
jgi:hypothetical protein